MENVPVQRIGQRQNPVVMVASAAVHTVCIGGRYGDLHEVCSPDCKLRLLQDGIAGGASFGLFLPHHPLRSGVPFSVGGLPRVHMDHSPVRCACTLRRLGSQADDARFAMSTSFRRPLYFKGR